MDGLTRLKHNVCGPGLCETRMHAYGRSLRALTEREATTHDHEREPVPGAGGASSRDAGTSLRATLLMLLHSRDLPFTTTRGTVRLSKQATSWLACLDGYAKTAKSTCTVPVPVNNVPDGKLPVCPMPLSHQDLEAIQGDVIPHPLFRPMRLTIT